MVQLVLQKLLYRRSGFTMRLQELSNTNNLNAVKLWHLHLSLSLLCNVQHTSAPFGDAPGTLRNVRSFASKAQTALSISRYIRYITRTLTTSQRPSNRSFDNLSRKFTFKYQFKIINTSVTNNTEKRSIDN